MFLKPCHGFNIADISADWSDHGLWWPQKRMWLLKPRLTLDTCGVQGDAKLHFTPIHKKVRVQLPDLQYVEVSTNFSSKVFGAVQELCAELGIRHPEEISLIKPNSRMRSKEGKRSVRGKTKKRLSGSSLSSDDNLSQNSDDKLRGSGDNLSPNYGSMPRHGYTTNGSLSPGCTSPTPSSPGYQNFGPEGPLTAIENAHLSSSPLAPSAEAVNMLYSPKSLQEKAQMNSG